MSLEILIFVLGTTGFLALMIFFYALKTLLQRHFIRGSLSLAVGITLILGVTATSLIMLNLLTYTRLTYEESLLTIRLKKIGKQKFEADLIYANKPATRYILRGDEWELDARVLKWNGAASLLGLKSLYRFDRIEGRFQDVETAKHSERTVYRLSNNPGLDLWSVARNNQSWLPWVDADYGEGLYLPMANNANYTVLLTSSGLIARPANNAARTTLKQWR